MDDDDAADIDDDTEEASIWNCGVNKEFKLTALHTHQKLWTLFGDVVPDPATRRRIQWKATESEAVPASDNDQKIPEERQWLQSDPRNVWRRVAYINDTDIDDDFHSLAKDAHQFNAYQKSIRGTQSVDHLIHHSEAGQRGLRFCGNALMQRAVDEMVKSVILELMDIREQAFDCMTRALLHGVLNIATDTERRLALSGKLELVRGVVRDFISNRNHVVTALNSEEDVSFQHAQLFGRTAVESAGHDNMQASSVLTMNDSDIQSYQRIRTDLTINLVCRAEEDCCDEVLQPNVYQRAKDFVSGLVLEPVDTASICDTMATWIPEPVTAAQLLDHCHEYSTLHTGVSSQDDGPEESLLLCGHSNGVLSFWRILWDLADIPRRKAPTPQVSSGTQPLRNPVSPQGLQFLGSTQQQMAAVGGSKVKDLRSRRQSGVLDLQVHPRDPYSIVVTQRHGAAAVHRLRYSLFAPLRHISDRGSARISPRSPRAQQLIVPPERRDLWSLLWQCFRSRAKPAPPPALTPAVNTDEDVFDIKNFNATRRIVSLLGDDLVYDTPALLSESALKQLARVLAQAEDRTRQEQQKQQKQKQRIRTSDTPIDDVPQPPIQRQHALYSEPDYRPQLLSACFHPAINSELTATSVLLSSSAGDLIKINVDMLLSSGDGRISPGSSSGSRGKGGGAAMLASGDASSTSFKRTTTSSSPVSAANAQRLLPPFNRTQHCSHEYVVPAQAPPEFVLKPALAAPVAMAGTAASAGVHHRVFREMMHFHRPPTAQSAGESQSQWLCVAPLRCEPTQQPGGLSPRRERMRQYRDRRGRERRGAVGGDDRDDGSPTRPAAADNPDDLSLNTVLSIDRDGFIAIWETQNRAYYQNVHWHVPRLSASLETVLHGSMNEELRRSDFHFPSATDESSSRTLVVFASTGTERPVDGKDNVKQAGQLQRKGRLLVQHRMWVAAMPAAPEATEKEKVRNKKSSRPSSSASSAAELPSPTTAAATSSSPVAKTGPANRVYVRLSKHPQSQTPSSSTENLHGNKHRHHASAPVECCQYHPVYVLWTNSVDRRKETISRWVAFRSYRRKSETAAGGTAAADEEVMCMLPVRPVLMRWTPTAAKVSPDKTCLVILLHLTPHDKQDEAETPNRWRFVLIDLSTLTWMPPHIDINTAGDEVTVLDFALSCGVFELRTGSRLLTVLLRCKNKASSSTTTTTAAVDSSTHRLQVYSTLNGLHNEPAQDVAVSTACERVSWCPSMRVILLHGTATGADAAAATAPQTNKKKKGANAHADKVASAVPIQMFRLRHQLDRDLVTAELWRTLPGQVASTTVPMLPFLLPPRPEGPAGGASPDDGDPKLRHLHRQQELRLITQSVHAWVEECVEDAAEISIIRDLGRQQGKVLSNLFGSEKFGAVEPTYWPTDRSIEVQILNVLHRRHIQYARYVSYFEVEEQERKQWAGEHHPQPEAQHEAGGSMHSSSSGHAPHVNDDEVQPIDDDNHIPTAKQEADDIGNKGEGSGDLQMEDIEDAEDEVAE